MAMIQRTMHTLIGLVVATLFGCALVHIAAMLFVYATLAAQGDPMDIHPGILAGAMWVGAMQGASVLAVAIPLGALLHLALMRASMTSLPAYLGAGLMVAAASALVLGLFNGFAFNTSFAVMGVASGLLGGSLFWLVRRPDRAR